MGLFSVEAVLRVVWRGPFAGKQGNGGRGFFPYGLIIDCDVNCRYERANS